jgi:hypothetical protein
MVIEVPASTAAPKEIDAVVAVIATAPEVAFKAADVVIEVFACNVRFVAAVTAFERLMLVVEDVIEMLASESIVPLVGFVISVEPAIVMFPVASTAPDIATDVPPEILKVPPWAVSAPAPVYVPVCEMVRDVLPVTEPASAIVLAVDESETLEPVEVIVPAALFETAPEPV